MANEGLHITDPPFSATNFAIHTKRSHVQTAEGRVFLIVGIGVPRKYFLWETFEINRITNDTDGMFKASGAGWELTPPVELKGKAFDSFRASCASFVSFRCVNDLPYTRTLLNLAEENRPPEEPTESVKFLRKLDSLLKLDDPTRDSIRSALGHYVPVRALSIRQPYAEAVMSGEKENEYRTGATNIRGRVFIYASQGRGSLEDIEYDKKRFGITNQTFDELPRGVLVGSVELYRCKGGNWFLRNPVRAARLLEPTNRPQPVWFFPFDRQDADLYFRVHSPMLYHDHLSV